MKKLKFDTLFLLIAVLFIYSCNEEENAVSLPKVTTNEINNYTQISASCGGVITSDEGSTILERGICFSTNQTPTIENDRTLDGSGAGSFESSIIGIKPNTKYYFRAYATNANGTGYGNTMSITTLPYGSVIDYDGNQYKTLILGNQEWMFENLKVTHYRNGDAIPLVTDNSSWIGQTIGAYCNYENLGSNGETYGRLYNVYVTQDERYICPTGWHIPSTTEVNSLKTEISAETFEKIEFFKIGGGNRQVSDGSFVDIATGYFWTSSSKDSDETWAFSFHDELSSDFTGANTHGFSIRCLKDN